MHRPRTLCLISHYFGFAEDIPGGFIGGSHDQARRARRERAVKRTIVWLKRLSSLLRVEIAVGGMPGKNILPIDIDCSDRIVSSFHIIWHLLAEAQRQFDNYDNIMVLEDDILVPSSTIRRMLDARPELVGTHDIIFPNRIELAYGLPVAVDLIVWPGWKGQSITWRGRKWYEANNPHSGFLFIGKHQADKFLAIDFANPTRTIGELTTSAFERAHSGYRLFREKRLIPRHYIFHQDSWCVRAGMHPGKIVEGFFRSYADPILFSRSTSPAKGQ